ALKTPVPRLAIIKTYEQSEFVAARNIPIITALICPIAGPHVGGYIVDYLSLNYIFLIKLQIVIIVILLSLKFMKKFYGDDTHLDLK
ncbi:MFS transporter, partial [Ornithobacterium rhinotracheale]